MARQALYRKWRSQTFEDVIGQKHITQTLQNAIGAGRVAHAYLFTGPRGTGKTSTARILAKAVNCVGTGSKPCNVCSICQAVNEGRLMDLIEIDAASNTSVDDIRDLRDKVDFRPGEARIKFYIIDEVHMLSKSAFNALLKTLEEPPPHVIFVLATTEPEKIPATIMSRCQRFDFRRIKVEDVAGRLHFIVEQEGLQAEEEALILIAHQGSGSMRDSISLLDQLTAYGDEVITLDLVRSVLGASDYAATKMFIDYTLQGDVSAGLSLINEIVHNGVEPRQFALEILEYLRGLLLVKYDNGAQFLDLPAEAVEAMQLQAASVSAPKLLKVIERFNLAIKEFKSGAGEVIIPQLPLELAFVEVTTTDTMVSEVALPTSTSAPVRPTEMPQPVTLPQPAQPPPQPPAEVEVAESKPVSSDQTEADLTITQAQLDAVGAELKRRNLGMAQGLLNSGQIVGINGNSIIMSLPSPLLRDRIEKVKPRILEVLDKVLGTSVDIEFIVGEGESQPVVSQSPPPSPASPPTTEEKKTTFEDDPLIKSALDLGGEIKGTRPINS